MTRTSQTFRCLAPSLTAIALSVLLFAPALLSLPEARAQAKPLCTISSDGASLQPDGSWAGPGCTASDGNGHPAHPDAKEQKGAKPDEKSSRATFLETHACMTTDGAEKANALFEDCKRVTSGSHGSCNIQQNSCEEIRKATQKGCWGLAAEGPDFCFTKYR